MKLIDSVFDSVAASIVIAIAAVLIPSVFILLSKLRRSSPVRLDDIRIAACDLDKTTFPPAGPNQMAQLRDNIEAMAAFERCGGFVFPVTGNNLPMAQVKVEVDGKPLRELRSNPGVFMNGGLVLGPGGIEIERHALGQLQLNHRDRDFVTAMLDFWDRNARSSLLEGLGLLFFTPHELCGYSGAYANVDGYCTAQRVVPRKHSRDEIIRDRELVLLLLVLFPPQPAHDERDPVEYYERETKPWQQKLQQEMQANGLMDCRASVASPPGVGDGIKVTLLKDPWPEMDINVAGVDKGSALARFLQAAEVKEYLHLPSSMQIDPAKHVAVFGDAANDIPMFDSIGDVQPCVRVAMPHATEQTLIGLSNVRAEVSEVLHDICKAKQRVGRGWWS